MAENFGFNSDSRSNISITPPHQISQDVPGSESLTPLSPQWLLPKPGFDKTGRGVEEHHIAPSSATGKLQESNKSLGNGDDMLDPQKKKGAFTPSLFKMQNGLHDHWGDEEREINSIVRNDRWRGGDRERGDPRRMDQKEILAVRNIGDTRRGPSWKNDFSNRDSNYEQRHESKWDTRWGPNDKDVNGLSEKSIGLGKDGDVAADKGLLDLTIHKKDEMEGVSFRPWRSSSSHFQQSGDPLYFQSASKQVPAFSHGRGRVGNSPPNFSLGHSRIGLSESLINNSGTHLVAASSNKGGIDQVEASASQYSRMKLLDIYRTLDMRSYGNLREGMVPVPLLTENKPLEPMALCAPCAEEKELLNRIDRGDIVSSGRPDVSKDGSFVRNSSDVSYSRRTELGSRESLDAIDDYKTDAMEAKFPHDNYSHEFPEEKQHLSTSGSKRETGRQKAYAASHSRKEGSGDDNKYRNTHDQPCTEALIMEEKDVGSGEIPWSALSLADRQQRFSHNYKDITTDVGEIVGLEPQKEMTENWGTHLAKPSYPKAERIWPTNEDPILKIQPPSLSSRDLEMRLLLEIPPEKLILHYKDPQGKIQGPFSGGDIIAWFEAGYFGLDLEVRLPSASNDSPYFLLGDVMPHLRAKVKTPSGFNPPKQSETFDVAGRANFGSLQNGQSGFTGIDLIRNGERFKQGSTSEAKNRFVESLMPSNTKSTYFEGTSFSKDVRGYRGMGACGRPSPLVDGGNMSLLGKGVAIERQSSVPNSYEYLSGSNSASMFPTSKIVHESLASPIVPSSVTDTAHFSQPWNPGLKGFQDPLLSGANTNWSNFRTPDTLDPLLLNQSQKFPPCAAVHLLQSRLPSQHQGSLTNLFTQNLDNLTVNATLDDMLSAGMLQDPKLLNMLHPQSQGPLSSLRPQAVDSLPTNLTQDKLQSGLLHNSRLLDTLQQQYLLQLHSQNAAMSHQLSPLDKLLLLKQQQKEEELQQHLLRQQQLSSQAIAECQSQTYTVDKTPARIQAAAMQNGDASSNFPHKPLSDVFDAGSNLSLAGLSDEQIASMLNLPPSLDSSFGHENTSKISLQFPGKIHGDANQQNSWPSPIHGQNEISHQKLLPAYTCAKQTDGSLQDALNVPISNKASLSNLTSSNSSRADETTVASADGPTATSAAFLNLSGEMCRNELTKIGIADDVEIHTQGSLHEQLRQGEIVDSKFCKDKAEETCEGKKTSVNLQKQKTISSSSGNVQANGSPLISSLQLKQFETLQPQHVNRTELGAPTDILEVIGSDTTIMAENLQLHPVGGYPPESSSTFHAGKMEEKGDTGHGEACFADNTEVQFEPRAWNGPPSVKPKSLSEIQEEEQRKTQIRTAVSGVSTSVSFASPSMPWAGIVASVGDKASQGTLGDVGGANESKGRERCFSLMGQKSQNDLSANGVVPESTGTEMELPNSMSSLSQQNMSTYVQSVDDDNFIEVKETKRSRKKSAKAKAKAKALASISSDLQANSSTGEKGRSSPAAQEKEISLAVPAGPSLGDFVPWKADAANTSTAPAWSVDSVKLDKPASLRDILKEQEKKASTTQCQKEMPAPSKSQSNQTSHGLRSLSTSLPKTAPPIRINSIASSQTISRDEDLFWGPSEYLKQEGKHKDYPRQTNQVIVGTKKTPVKGIPDMPMTQEKYSVLKGDQSSLSSLHMQMESSMQGKGEATSKLSEAMDFRNWCERECARLFGSTDTSVLEFFLKLSRSEAQMILIENLGSLDPDHAFIDKFLNYMDLLPRDVLDVAFRNPTDGKVPDVISTFNILSNDNFDQDTILGLDGSAKSGGKKKGKKGRKVSPSVLGFNVVSNRILMGEIQTVDD